MKHRDAMLHRAVELRERVSYLKRLAFYTITEESAVKSEYFRLTGSKAEEIDVVLTVDEVDLEAMRRAFDCSVTYAATIEESGIKRNIPREAVFELYHEAYDPPLEGLVGQLADRKVSER